MVISRVFRFIIVKIKDAVAGCVGGRLPAHPRSPAQGGPGATSQHPIMVMNIWYYSRPIFEFSGRFRDRMPERMHPIQSKKCEVVYLFLLKA